MWEWEWECVGIFACGMQPSPWMERVYPRRQRRTTHPPAKQATSATPGRAVQSVPVGEYRVRGNMQPPPGRDRLNVKSDVHIHTSGTLAYPSTHSFRGRALYQRTPTRDDRRRRHHTLPIPVPTPCKSHCRPSSSCGFLACSWDTPQDGRTGRCR